MRNYLEQIDYNASLEIAKALRDNPETVLGRYLGCAATPQTVTSMADDIAEAYRARCFARGARPYHVMRLHVEGCNVVVSYDEDARAR